MFRVYTDPSPCPRFLSRMSVSEHVATCSDFLGHGRPSLSEVVQYAYSCGRYCRLPKWGWPRMTSDPSLGCSVNTILSGARTRTRTPVCERVFSEVIDHPDSNDSAVRQRTPRPWQWAGIRRCSASAPPARPIQTWPVQTSAATLPNHAGAPPT